MKKYIKIVDGVNLKNQVGLTISVFIVWVKLRNQVELIKTLQWVNLGILKFFGLTNSDFEISSFWVNLERLFSITIRKWSVSLEIH